MAVVTPPKDRLGSLFKLMGDVTLAADRAVLATPHAQERLVRFDAEILIRGINSVKSVRCLMEQGHWEHAVGITRQLFELLVNMEYLHTLEDRYQGTFDYVNFGLLQQVQAHHRGMMYLQETGRPVDAERLAFLQGLLDDSFPEFKGKVKPDGTQGWVPSWSRKSTRALAELSGDVMRPHQYQQLFTLWSEQSHATPGSFIENMLRGDEEDWIEKAVAVDDKKIVETAGMTLMFFIQLWAKLPNVNPLPPTFVDWTRQMMQMIGAPEFDSLPGFLVKDPE